MKWLAFRVGQWVILWALMAACSAHANDPRIKVNFERQVMRLSPAALIWHDAQGERSLDDWRSALEAPLPNGAAGVTTPGFTWIDASQQPLG